MQTNPLKQLRDFGQSPWLDFISRQLITSGGLKKMIDIDGLGGVTSNPSIFEKSISAGKDYDPQIIELVKESRTTFEIMQALMIEDIQTAADVLRPVYDSTEGQDGFVSLEVSPHLASDTRATIEEARRLWTIVDRPNVFIKVPATSQGIPAIAELISQGLNINITLLFGLSRYKEVTDAYLTGLEALDKSGKDLDRTASVASFFLSRIDVMIDPMLEEFTKYENKNAHLASELIGQVAIAEAKVAYQMFKQVFGSSRFRKLTERGARVQRVLWASTGTKNPSYSDIKYVEPLIGPQTVNTMPLETMNAYRDHGNPASRIEDDVDKAYQTLDALKNFAIDLEDIRERLEVEGVEKFNKPYDSLLEILERKVAVIQNDLYAHRL